MNPDAFLGSSVRFNARTLDACPNLKIIARAGVGYDSIDVPEATKRGIAVTITPGAGAEAVAEYTLTLMLAAARRVTEANSGAKNGKWVRYPGPSLFRKTLGVIGTGYIGKKLIEISRGFNMKVVAYDLKRDQAYADRAGILYCDSLEELLKQSDFVSIHVPLVPQTIDLIGERELAWMKPTACLINCSRGGIVNEQALYNALVNKVIFGAGIDVFASEPVEMSNPLLTLDNLVASTHNAGTSLEGKNSIVGGAVVNIVEYSKGEKPYGILNPEVLL